MSSEDLLEVKIIGYSFSICRLYISLIDSIALIFDVPTIILSGFSKSVIADPSLKNSGFETTSNFLLGFFLDIISSILSHVPTGTVDFTIIILLS